jgi:hypothetical protein
MFESITSALQNITVFQILAVITIIVLILGYIYKNMDVDTRHVLIKMTPLDVKKDVVTADIVQSTLLGTSGSTVMCFINLQDGNRTASYTNDYVPLVFIDNNWFLEVAHQASSTSARLRVQTNNAGTTNTELIELPTIPRQKWVFIAVLREGRRFDVIYDNRIVASHRLMYYPVVISSPLSIGNDTLHGKAIHMIINGTRLTPDQVERQRLVYVNTNNEILEDNSIIMSLPTINLFAECPPGLPCDTITVPPKNKMLEWKTPYA